MNARDICSEVYNLSGFGAVSSYQNGDIDDRLIFALLRRVARDIAKYRWQELLRTGLIHITADNNTYNLPVDFREMIPNSMRALNDSRVIDFPAPFETWAHIEANTGASGAAHRLRFQEGKLVVPSVQAGKSRGRIKGGVNASSDVYSIRFDYISNFPVIVAPDSDIDPNKRLKTFSTDDDIWLLDEDLIIKGLKVKWSVEKGLETLQSDSADFVAYLNELKGTQAGSRRILIGGNSGSHLSPPYTNTWK